MPISGHVVDELLDLIGQPVPCALCKTVTPVDQLREVSVPGAVIFDGEITVNRIVWVCPNCPG